jgi:hypothetical protein
MRRWTLGVVVCLVLASAAWAAPVAGSGWSVVRSPNPSAGTGQLFSVACVGRSWCVAVGSHVRQSGGGRDACRAWEGEAVERAALAEPGGGAREHPERCGLHDAAVLHGGGRVFRSFWGASNACGEVDGRSVADRVDSAYARDGVELASWCLVRVAPGVFGCWAVGIDASCGAMGWKGLGFRACS